MDWFQALVLALIQGLTEFLPISSSAHLILPSQILGWPDQGPAGMGQGRFNSARCQGTGNNVQDSAPRFDGLPDHG